MLSSETLLLSGRGEASAASGALVLKLAFLSGRLNIRRGPGVDAGEGWLRLGVDRK